MKHLFLAALATIGLISCQNGKNPAEESADNVIVTTDYLNFGDSTFNVENAFTAAEVVENMASDLDGHNVMKWNDAKDNAMLTLLY